MYYILVDRYNVLYNILQIYKNYNVQNSIYVYIYIYMYTQCNKSFVDRYNVFVDRYNYWYQYIIIDT